MLPLRCLTGFWMHLQKLLLEWFILECFLVDFVTFFLKSYLIFKKIKMVVPCCWFIQVASFHRKSITLNEKNVVGINCREINFERLFLSFISISTIVVDKDDQGVERWHRYSDITNIWLANISTFRYSLFHNHKMSVVLVKFITVYKTTMQCFQQKRRR